MNTETLIVDATEPDSRSLDQAAQVLADGGIVGLPTETVYGLAARVDHKDAMARLAELKGDRGDKPYSIHIADFEDLDGLVRDVPASCRLLTEKYWPGPLTIVMPDGAAGMGVRMPAHKVAREVIRRSGVHAICPSANPSNQDPATSADTVLEYFQGKLEVVVDAGPTLIKESSTVVVFKNHLEWEIVREGLISRKMIASTACQSVLFVCTGNSCRSPIAELLCCRYLSRALGCEENKLLEHGYRVISAGTAAFPGGRASQQAIDAMKEEGYDLSEHQTQSATPDMVDHATWVIALARRHQESITSLMPNAADKVRMLDLSGQDVEDPAGGGEGDYRDCIETIDDLLEDLIPFLLGRDS
jgi:protein-tyrosine phosphatase